MTPPIVSCLIELVRGEILGYRGFSALQTRNLRESLTLWGSRVPRIRDRAAGMRLNPKKITTPSLISSGSDGRNAALIRRASFGSVSGEDVMTLFSAAPSAHRSRSASQPDQMSVQAWAAIPGRRLFRHNASTPKSSPKTAMRATWASPW